MAFSSVARGNIYMIVSKTFSGLNQNALRYLLPKWLNPHAGVLLRLGAGALLFWILGLLTRSEQKTKISWFQRLQLFAVGLFLVFGYMWCLLEGLTYTTPISSSIFISLQPVFTFIICLFLKTERLTISKSIGIALGVGGALTIVLTQKSTDIATNPVLGNMLCLAGAVIYAFYLVLEKFFLKTMSNATMSKWTFFGGSVSAFVMIVFTDWEAPVLTMNLFSTPMLVLLFVLVFPSFISYLLSDMSLKILPATVVALYGELILIVAAIASYILGQDVFDWWQPLAIGLMIAGVYFVEHSEKMTNSLSAISAEGKDVASKDNAK